MNNNVEKSKELFLKGYNCCQAIVGGFCEDYNIEFETAMKITSSFGGGMGGLREVCGAVSGAFMIAGLKKGYIFPDSAEVKAEHNKLIQSLAKSFKEKWGTIKCGELMKKLSEEKGEVLEKLGEDYKKRPCLIIVEEMAKILDETINE